MLLVAAQMSTVTFDEIVRSEPSGVVRQFMGREALAEIKNDPVLRRIPVVILTTSKAEEDMLRGYDLGAASYISKPVTFEGLVRLRQAIGRYWIEFVELPGTRVRH